MSKGGKAKRQNLGQLTTHSLQYPTRSIRSIAKEDKISLEQALVNVPNGINALPQAPQRFDIEDNLRHRDNSVGWRRKLSWFVLSFPYLQKIRRDTVRTFMSLEANPAFPKQEIAPEFLNRFVTLAKSYGIGAVGYAPLPREAIFQGKAVLYDQVIVLIMEMDAAKMAQAPSRTTFRMVMQTYYDLGHVVNHLVDFLRAGGFAAQAGHPLNGLTLYPIVAQNAGMGWCGSNGLIITPEFGPRQRTGVIYTNIRNLPVTGENRHAWIADLCARCGQCIRQCPSQAIYDEPIRRPSGIVTHIDVENCFPVFAAQYGCSLCIKVCPFNLHPYEKIKQKFLRGSSTSLDVE